MSSERGRYSFEYLSVGGPYTVEAKAIGYQPASSVGILLTLGERDPEQQLRDDEGTRWRMQLGARSTF